MCERDRFIVQIKPTVKFDELGIENLAIKCATKDGYIPDNEYVDSITFQKHCFSYLIFQITVLFYSPLVVLTNFTI